MPTATVTHFVALPDPSIRRASNVGRYTPTNRDSRVKLSRVSQHPDGTMVRITSSKGSKCYARGSVHNGAINGWIKAFERGENPTC